MKKIRLLNKLHSKSKMLTSNKKNNPKMINTPFHKLLSKTDYLLPILPDWITGRTDVLDAKLHDRYGEKDCKSLIRELKLSNLKKYLMTIVIFSLFALLMVMNSLFQSNEGPIKNNGELSYIERPKVGETKQAVKLHVEVKNANHKLDKNIILDINAKTLTTKEKEMILKKYVSNLPSYILGENESMKKITKQLNLIERDNQYGITIEWNTSNPNVVSNTGEIGIVSSQNGQKVKLTAEVEFGELNTTKEILVNVIRPNSKDDMDKLLESKLVTLTSRLEDCETGNHLILPDYVEGSSLQWTVKRGNQGFLLLIIFITIISSIYRGRYQKIDQEWKAAQKSILKDFPDFVHKLVLLLNAGLVPTTALLKVIDDYSKNRSERRELNEELMDIQRRVRETNHSIIIEIRDFSKRTGIRELMRFSTILYENINKGTALAEKLEAEVELLWLSRKSNAEVMGKLAETKLTLPLMILLIVLIVITIAPALLEM